MFLQLCALGLYECECEALLEGDGFTCLEVIDPVIGRRSFVRQAPPYYWLYEVELNLEKTGTVDHKCFDGELTMYRDS